MSECMHGVDIAAPACDACEAEKTAAGLREHETPETFRARVRAAFESAPGQDIDGLTLAGVGGAYAWRTRVSEVRRELERAGLGTIVNHVVCLANKSKRSYYRYDPTSGRAPVVLRGAPCTDDVAI